VHVRLVAVDGHPLVALRVEAFPDLERAVGPVVVAAPRDQRQDANGGMVGDGQDVTFASTARPTGRPS
jgi:hypothetical protein